MAAIELRLNPTHRELKQFGLMALAAFALLGCWIAYRQRIPFVHLGDTAWMVAYVLGGVGLLSGLFSLVYPAANRPLWVILMAAAYPIGMVVSMVLMATIFYAILTPIGLVFRLIGRDPLHRRFDPNARTYWVPRRPVHDVNRYFRQF